MKMVAIDEKVMKKLRETQIEVLNEIVRICEKNDIKYYLMGGTLLGAIRHKGYIPWDDDLDIGMLREDYERFIEIAPYELSDEYYLETRKYNKNFYLEFSKLKKNNTEFNEQALENLDIHKGIFVDIFPYDKIDNSRKFLSKIRNIYIIYAIESIFVKYKFKKLKDTRRPFICGLYQIFPATFILNMQQRFMKMDRNRKTDYVCNFVGGLSVSKATINKNIFDEQVMVEFEGQKYTTFKDYEKYLTQVYGDYMKLPPVEERVNHCPKNIDFEHGENIITKDLIKK